MSRRAAAEPEAPATAPVILQVTEDALLGLLRLPEGTSVAGAQVERLRGPRLVLYLEMAGVPDGADEVHLEYERDTNGYPVRLTGLVWLHDGDEISRTVPGGQQGAGGLPFGVTRL